MESERIVKIAQQLTFTTFLILCVVVMGYVIVRLYDDNQSAWAQVNAYGKTVEQLDKDINYLTRQIEYLRGLRPTELPAPKGPF